MFRKEEIMRPKKIPGAFSPLFAGAAAALLFLLFYALHGFYPFGARSVVWCDMDQQYVPLLMELKTAFGDGSLFLGRGGGVMNFYGVFLFFVSSPLSLLSLAVDNSDMIWFMNILLVIKAALCAVSAGFYFRKVIPDLPDVFGIIISVMYAVSGYVMMYYQNNMWLDMMTVFPLLLISLFRLLETGKWGAYTVCTAVCMLLNFYISFMIAAFLVMFDGAALYLCCDSGKRGSRALRLIAGDVCAALLSGVVWIPAFMQYSSSGRGNSLGSVYFGGWFFENVFDKAALLSGSGLVLAGAVLAVIFRRSIKNGKMLLFAVSGLVSLAGAFIDPTNKLLHTGSYQAYPLRYGFIVILLMFSFSGELIASADGRKAEKPAYAVTSAAALISAAAAVTAYFFRSHLSSYVNSLWVSTDDGLVLTAVGAAAAAAYLLCIRNYCSGRISRAFTVCTAAAVMICESLLSFGVNVDALYDSTYGFTRTAEAFSAIPDEGFVRVKSGKKYYYSNYAEGFGRYSLSHYTSLTDCDLLFTLKRLGYSSHWLDTTSSGGTLIIDELLLNKYIIGSPQGRCRAYENYELSGGLPVYNDPNVLGGALVSGVKPEELADLEKYERVEASGFVAEKLLGGHGLVQKLSPDSFKGAGMSEKDGKTRVSRLSDSVSQLEYSFHADGRKELYFDIFGCYSTNIDEKYYGSADIFVNGRLLQSNYPSGACNGIIDLGTFENEDVKVTVKVLKDFEVTSFGLWLYDLDLSEALAASARTAPAEINGRKLTVSAEIGGYLYIPVAWSEGWSCKVNGKKAPVIRALGAFMAVELPEGGGSVEMSFLPVGMKTGAAVSAAGAVLFILLLIVLKKERDPGKTGVAAEKTLYLLSIVTICACYIAAPVAWLAVNIVKLLFGG